MLGVRSMLGVTFLLIALTPAPACAADGLEFLDTRPIAIDLDRTSAGQQWRIRVLDGQSGAGHTLTLHVAFQPTGIIAIAGAPVRRASQGEVTEFVIELRRRVEGSGELVAVSGGTIVRRPISTTLNASAGSVEVGSLQFAGVRLVPFTGAVRVAGLTVPDAPGRIEPAERLGIPRRIGVLTSARGDLADVVRRGDDFFVQGVDDVGEYAGSVDLLPSGEGGEAEATLRVRDLPVWPLLVLLLGLGVVQALDRYQRRLRPRRLLELRLARLRDRARATERDTDLALRVCAMPGDPGLLLDKLVAEALAAADQHLTDAERAAWEADGTEYKKLFGVVESFRQVADSYRGLRAELTSFLDAAEAVDREQVKKALAESVVGVGLRGRAIESTTELTETATQLDEARKYLREFRRIYRTLVRLRSTASDDLRAETIRVLTKLFDSPGDLAGVNVETDELYRRWQPTILPAEPTPSFPLGPLETRAQPPPPPAATAPSAAQRGRLRRVLPVAVAASVVVIGSVFALSLGGGVNDGASPRPTATPTPSDAPTTPVLPEAPVAAPPQAPVARGFEVSGPSTGQILWFGLVLPLLLAGGLGAVGWLVLRSWRQRQAPRRLADLDTATIDRDVRVENVRFSLASGALVVLSGMSLLYVGNPTFGTPGDYLTVALWGTAVGEGLHLARRLWPFPSTP
jgi:hypothetical protein